MLHFLYNFYKNNTNVCNSLNQSLCLYSQFFTMMVFIVSQIGSVAIFFNWIINLKIKISYTDNMSERKRTC